MTAFSANSSMEQKFELPFKNSLGLKAFKETIVTRIPQSAFMVTGEKWSGKVFKMDSNRLRIRTLSFDFRERQEAVIKMSSPFGLMRVPIRTDGVYRFMRLQGLDGRAPKQVGIRGRWIGMNLFRLEWIVVGEPHRYMINLYFFGDAVVASVRPAQNRWDRFWVKGNIEKNG